jgi:hypothetical protein
MKVLIYALAFESGEIRSSETEIQSSDNSVRLAIYEDCGRGEIIIRTDADLTVSTSGQEKTITLKN